MSSSTFVTLALLLPAIFFFWTMSSTTSSPFARSFPRLYNKRICLLIAHPDDEAMFFSPAVMALTKPELGNHLKILCLSSGDADGLGHVRKKELEKSATHLGLRHESDVYVVDDPLRFPDSMSVSWSESDISNVLFSAFAPDLAASSRRNPNLKRSRNNNNITTTTTTTTNKKGEPPNVTIDVLLTFDKYGISNHPNHRSLYHGAIHFLKTLMEKDNNNNNDNKSGSSCPISLYTLTTTNILRKYLGILDAPITMLLGVLDGLVSIVSRTATTTTSRKSGHRQQYQRSGQGSPSPIRLLFVNSVQEWLDAQSAMVKGHRSQMVWFRWGWITIGRYMVVNDLKLERIVSL